MLSRESTIASQAGIGWHQAMKGFLSTKWRALAEMDQYDKNTRNEHLGVQRMTQIIKGLYKYHRMRRLSRNKVLHKKDLITMAEICSTELAKIKHYHSHPELLTSADRYLCQQSLDKLMCRAAATLNILLACRRVVTLN
jgi:hypothetical protein